MENWSKPLLKVRKNNYISKYNLESDTKNIADKAQKQNVRSFIYFKINLSGCGLEKHFTMQKPVVSWKLCFKNLIFLWKLFYLTLSNN